MKLDSLNNIDLDMKVLVIGDCATNHIEKYTGLDNIISRQIQGGLGAEKEIANINKPSAIMLFVSWANALSVITDEDILPVPIKPNFIIYAQYIRLIIFQLINKKRPSYS
mgnify:CR=1 FL=1